MFSLDKTKTDNKKDKKEVKKKKEKIIEAS